MDFCKEAGVNIPDTIVDWVHRIGVAYGDNIITYFHFTLG